MRFKALKDKRNKDVFVDLLLDAGSEPYITVTFEQNPAELTSQGADDLGQALVKAAKAHRDLVSGKA